ncbi:hypothetical protein LSUE1_G000867 [Lachnellula suecica]|uniref:Signal peptide-containing protein n=1 Tax=Lachnellula suecica TaxID=602035 RepID=A0A8T9CKC6_9HELO|nr:hypothetical protein LSUE1_G000867 [Lachnellula suecica]
MSLDVALQSVAFYVLSCSTCAKISHRRKAKAQARRERAEKAELETEQPGLYRHPSPFSTNPYWTEEIMMGPGPPKQSKGSSKNTSQRALNTGGSSYAGSTAVSTDPSSSPTAATEGSRLSGEGWNRKRYQRADEALWGIDLPGTGQKIKDAISKAGSSAGRLLETRLSKGGTIKEESPGPYYLAKNPPVNDLHPPVVSTQPASRDETRWMLQPPPSAKIMEGKVKVVNRNRASSNGSSLKTPLSRQATERIKEERLQGDDTTPSRAESRSKSGRSSRQRQQRHESSSPSSDDSISVMKRRKKPPPLTLASPGKSSRDTAEHIPIPSRDSVPPSASDMRERPARPLLSTIVSSSVAVPKTTSDDTPLALRELSPRLTNSVLSSREPSPSKRLSPSANSMPASIPRLESKPHAKSEIIVPKRAYIENSE